MHHSAVKMWSRSVLLMSMAVASGALNLDLGSRPRYIGCQTSDECAKDACCVIGMGRYSIPTCQPRRDLGEQCRPMSEPVNTTLTYPDGASVDLSGVFYVVCPCQGGLTCADNMECVEHLVGNHIDQQYDYSEENNFHY